MQEILKSKRICQRGAILTLVLVYGAIFVLLFSSLSGFVFFIYRQSREKIVLSKAMAIAEAGVNWSRWHLAHSPSDFTFSGTYNYTDQESGVIGQYELEVTAPPACSTTATIRSTGWTSELPDIKRAITVRYGQPSLAQYAFLTDADVWFGENEDVQGPLHANGGIRMDGTQNSIFTSAKETYMCQPYHDCNPAQEKPGIWGSGVGGTQGLWYFDVPPVNFDSLTMDLDVLRTTARDGGGYYFEPSGEFGYRVEFKNNGTFDLYKVTRLWGAVDACDTEGNCFSTQDDIRNQSLVGNYPLGAAGCGVQNLIFIEDGKVWVDGVLREKATVVAARLPDDPVTRSTIVINGNISRADPRDTMLALIAQKHVIVPYRSPNVLEIQAVMIAQHGAVQRYYYGSGSNRLRNSIMVRGSIISRKTWTWSWVNGSGDIISGYQETESHYEPALIYNPPPYFPTTGDLQFISWDEVDP